MDGDWSVRGTGTRKKTFLGPAEECFGRKQEDEVRTPSIHAFVAFLKALQKLLSMERVGSAHFPSPKGQPRVGGCGRLINGSLKIISFHCQLGKIWSHLGDKLPGDY